MGTARSNWEQGSDFHWPITGMSPAAAMHPWSGPGASYFGSGRDALRGLVAHGVVRHGWRRIWFPAYFCPDVVAALRMAGVETAVYRDSPVERPVWPAGLGDSDVVLVMNYFGLRACVETTAVRDQGAFVVENHTHDPWSPWAAASQADFCIVSLRKTLPVPDGGVVWSPRGRDLPDEPPLTYLHGETAETKHAAMAMKSAYLAGGPVRKEDFRELFAAGERNVSAGPVSGISPEARRRVDTFNVQAWRERRCANFEVLRRILQDAVGLRLLQPEGDCVPFSGFLIAGDPLRRGLLRDALVARRIYPAVLWDLSVAPADGIPGDIVDLSQRVLSIHCDGRYDEADMRIVARAVLEACT
jgi:hypothetical protein